MNKRTTILSVLALLFFFIFLFTILRFSIPKSQNPTVQNRQTNFIYTGSIENISGNKIDINAWDGKTISLDVYSGSVLLGIDISRVTLDNIKKGFIVEVSGVEVDNIKKIEKLRIIKEDNIILYEPKENQKVFGKVELKGIARVFENSFNYRIKDSKGKIIKEGILSTDSKDAGLFGNFDISLDINDNLTGTGEIEVFEYSPKDGTEVNKTSVSILFGR